MKHVYKSAFGDYELPADVLARSIRWREYWPDYLEKWCEWQYAKKRVA